MSAVVCSVCVCVCVCVCVHTHTHTHTRRHTWSPEADVWCSISPLPNFRQRHKSLCLSFSTDKTERYHENLGNSHKSVKTRACYGEKGICCGKCAGLNEIGPHRLSILNVLSLVRGTI